MFAYSIQITYMDFHVYETFAVLRIFEASIFDTLPTLVVSNASSSSSKEPLLVRTILVKMGQFECLGALT